MDYHFQELRLSRAFAVEFEKWAMENPKLIPTNVMESYMKLKQQYEIEISGEDRAQEFLDDIKKLNTPDDVYNYYAYDRDWKGSMDDDLKNIIWNYMSMNINILISRTISAEINTISTIFTC